MKELSIEEKAKRYDEALEAIKSLQEVNPSDEGIQNWVNENFPELTESEDERIRKELLAWLKRTDGQTLPIDRYNAAVAWLEKQGDIPAGAVLDSNKDGLIADTFNTKGEQKPWSEEDESMLFNVIHRIEQLDHYWNKPTDEKMIDWLKSLKDRVLSQPKQEWSKEDEAFYQRLEQIVCKVDIEAFQGDIDLHSWLKSLRPQSTWKPSDEQMKQLHKYCPDNRPLTELYEQLKKLKG